MEAFESYELCLKHFESNETIVEIVCLAIHSPRELLPTSQKQCFEVSSVIFLIRDCMHESTCLLFRMDNHLLALILSKLKATSTGFNTSR